MLLLQWYGFRMRMSVSHSLNIFPAFICMQRFWKVLSIGRKKQNIVRIIFCAAYLCLSLISSHQENSPSLIGQMYCVLLHRLYLREIRMIRKYGGINIIILGPDEIAQSRIWLLNPNYAICRYNSILQMYELNPITSNWYLY